jgi:sporulation protein YlmC with PRC-barrel domain
MFLVASSIARHEKERHDTVGMTTVALPREEAMRLSDKTLHGRPVVSADGKVIGTVSELFVSTADWRVESIRIELHKDIADRIGADRTIFHRGTIELPVGFVQSVGDAVVLGVEVEQLREAHRAPATDAPPQASP